jgi:hypothetical protein
MFWQLGAPLAAGPHFFLSQEEKGGAWSDPLPFFIKSVGV